MQAARPLQLGEGCAGMPRGAEHLGSPGGSVSPGPQAVLCPALLPGFGIFLGSAGCGMAPLIVPFSSYLQIPFLRCGTKLSKGEDNKGTWRVSARGGAR